MEPAPSAASAAGTIPAATAAAEPPLEPPGVRPVSHGLRVTPHVTDSVNGQRPSSGIVVLPTMTAPAARSRATTAASSGAGARERAGTPARDVAREVDLVLDGDRHPEERAVLARGAPAIGLVCLGQRPVPQDGAERVQRGIERRDARQRELGQLPRRGVAPAHELRLACDSGERCLGVEHRGNLLPVSGPRRAPPRSDARARPPCRRSCGRSAPARARRRACPCGPDRARP